MERRKSHKKPAAEKTFSLRGLSDSLRTELETSQLSSIRRTYLLEKLKLLEFMSEESK